MSLEQFLAILKARWKSTLLVFLLTVGVSVTVSLLLPKQYSATASVVVDLKPDPVTAMIYGNLPPPALMGTQVEILQSERVARRVIRNLKLADSPQVRDQWREATAGVGSIETWLVDTFQKRLDVKPSREAGVISVTYKAPDPNFAAGVANAYVQAYLETSLALRVDPAKQYSTFFDGRAKEARDVLEKAQAKLSAFQKAAGIIATDERFDIENTRLSELSSQAVALQALSSEAGSRQAQARGASADKMQEVLNNPLIGALKTDMARAEARLQELNARLGSDHPQVVEGRANIASLRSRIETETQRVTGGVGVSENIARQRGAEVQAALERQRAQVLRMKAVRDEGSVLVRDVESAQRAFEAVVARFNQSTLESQTTQSNVSLLTAAEPPLEPSSPKILLNTAAAVLLGGLLSIGGAMVLELVNRRVRSNQDISLTLGLPMLGELAPTLRRTLLGRRSPSLAEQRMVGLARRNRPPAQAIATATATTAVAASRPSEAIVVNENKARTAPVLDRSIGELIAEACKLSPEQIEKIVARQRKTGVRFGEAAIELGLATTDDVLFALAKQYHYPYATPDERKLSPELVALNEPFSAQAESFRAIRSQVMKRVFNDLSRPRRALAIVSPNSGDGKTFFTANLAVSLAQLGGRTLLIDADLRGPRQHEVFNLSTAAGLAGILSGRTPDSPVIQLVPGVPGLFLLPVGSAPPNPLELVERPAFGFLLNELRAKFDYVLVDTPAAQFGSDAAVIAERCGASLMIARQDVSRIADIEELAIELTDENPKLMGVVVNSYRA
jgi:chain length determinant protein tyrosine kinase EpsG